MSKIKALRENLGISQADLAARVNTTQPQINRLEKGLRKLTKEWAERLAPHLRTKPEVLLFGDRIVTTANKTHENPQLISEVPNAIIGARLEGEGVRIPVYGQAVGGVDGEFVMNGNILFEVMAPPSLAGVSGAYAVTVSGDSMSPRYEDGEVCFVDPKRRVKRGDYVIAQIVLVEDGPILAFAKRFIRQNSEELVLEQFNPAKELRFPSDRVHAVHFIALSGIA